jgi:hypothetical protein
MLQFPADDNAPVPCRQLEILVEVNKCYHIFQTLGKTYNFTLSNANNLPNDVNGFSQVESVALE